MSRDMEVHTAPAGTPPPVGPLTSDWRVLGTLTPDSPGPTVDDDPNVTGWGAPPECEICQRPATHRAGDALLCSKCVVILGADQPRRARRASAYHGPRAIPIGGDDRG